MTDGWIGMVVIITPAVIFTGLLIYVVLKAMGEE